MQFLPLLAFAGLSASLDAPRTAIPMGLPSPNTENVQDVRVLPAHGGVASVPSNSDCQTSSD